MKIVSLNKITLLVIINCLLFPVIVQAAYTHPANDGCDTVYVSCKGSDIQGNGTAGSPFYSLNKAVKGKFFPDQLLDTLFVLVAPGDYFMQEPFSIQSPSSRPVVIKAQQTEKPRFLGGVRIGRNGKNEFYQIVNNSILKQK